jgi:two-component system phosphate regulon sensor histidine kinase PhoR
LKNNNQLLYGDRDKFLQIVLNLVENAIKYSNPGVEVIVRSYSEKGNLCTTGSGYWNRYS